MARIPLSTYISINAPDKGKQLLALYNVRLQNGSQKEIASRLSDLLAKYGDDALFDMANMHPDKDLIIRVHEMNEEYKNSTKEQSDIGSSNCDGCKKCKSKASSFGGAWNSDEPAAGGSMTQEFAVYGADGVQKTEGAIPMVLFGGIALIFGYLIYKG